MKMKQASSANDRTFQIETLYVMLLVQFVMFVVMTLYLVFTLPIYPSNYVWFMLWSFIALLGFIRGLNPALIGAMFAAFGYGSYLLYHVYVIGSLREVSFNDLYWIVAFPAGALVAGFLGRVVQQFTANYERLIADHDLHTTIDTVTGLSNYRQFVEEAETEISRSVRYGHSVTLVLIEVAYYKELLQEYGGEAVGQFMQRTAATMDQVLRDVDKKAYLNDGVFGIILPETPLEHVSYVLDRLGPQLKQGTMQTAKGTKEISLRIRYGYAGCPEDGAEFALLYDKARQGLMQHVG
ncbi:GGDEF domain-containing protein [Paenibacillus sp. 481]|uniref:GGDEF domain-containing protein n=1 Tax=Paenibacillus sp. 481 TaxID=2835869 RepID=UPI001E37CB96|nr:diguanylate cyclase [Paenibacillus sp. 481]UHA74408.1 diguanylate cyclase [Paenibacillus sp. 481]